MQERSEEQTMSRLLELENEGLPTGAPRCWVSGTRPLSRFRRWGALMCTGMAWTTPRAASDDPLTRDNSLSEEEEP